MNNDNIDLLILDYSGVCTASVLFRLLVIDIRDGDGVRRECEELVKEAQEAGIAVAVLSNEMTKDWARTIPLLATVDHVVACADNNIFKPDRRAFQRCLLLADTEPERALVVDDEPDNITVAASLGMHTVLFDETQTSASWSAVHEKLS